MCTCYSEKLLIVEIWQIIVRKLAYQFEKEIILNSKQVQLLPCLNLEKMLSSVILAKFSDSLNSC